MKYIHQRYPRPILLGLLLTFFAVFVTATEPKFPNDFAGHWTGRAEVIVSWCEQDSIEVDLRIDPEGRVHGTVGDARLEHGILSRNRGAVGRVLHLGTDFIIRGELDGPMVAAEGIERKKVCLPLNFRNETLVGSVATDGTHFGGKESMVFTAAHLELRRDTETSSDASLQAPASLNLPQKSI